MSEAMHTQDATGQPKFPGVGFGINWGVGNLLKAQAEILTGFEPAISDWLRRRHEAMLDVRQLAARLNTGGDPSELLKAQRDWVSRSLHRMAADAEAYQSAVQQFIDRTRSIFPSNPDNGDSAAAQAATTRAAGKPLRMTTKTD